MMRVESLLRELAPQVLGAVARGRDFADAEDAVQEALLAASLQWPEEGLPDDPRGWLIVVALRRMTDGMRSRRARRQREDLAAPREVEQDVAPPSIDRDDSLLLFFMRCHPALTAGSAIPLTLRAVGGLRTAGIARAFLVPEATMAQRISRAKQRIKASGIPFAMPAAEESAARLRSVLHVLYLIFTEGHAATTGALVSRADLSAEAIRLTRMLHVSRPDDPEVTVSSRSWCSTTPAALRAQVPAASSSGWGSRTARSGMPRSSRRVWR